MDAPTSRPVTDLFAASEQLDVLLASSGETSLRIEIADALNKACLLAAASHLETVVIFLIEAFVRRVGTDNEALVAFVNNQALSRRYHTLFSWDGSNANQFFGLFGSGPLDRYNARVSTDEAAAHATSSFLELGRLRNQVAHGNFVVFSLPKTREELHDLFQAAVQFPPLLEELLDGA